MSDSVTKYFENRQDEVVEDVLNLYKQRSKVGIEKYGTTLQESKEGHAAFVRHLLEELMDATLYCKKILKIMEDKTEEQKFTEARIEFLLEQIAKQNNHITLLKGEIDHLKRILSQYEKGV